MYSSSLWKVSLGSTRPKIRKATALERLCYRLLRMKSMTPSSIEYCFPVNIRDSGAFLCVPGPSCYERDSTC